jgi:hypothetical protein
MINLSALDGRKGKKNVEGEVKNKAGLQSQLELVELDIV